LLVAIADVAAVDVAAAIAAIAVVAAGWLFCAVAQLKTQ